MSDARDAESASLEHLDDRGLPCARHAPPAPAALLSLATTGSRARSFHHDLASKLQGLMMALEELGDHVEGEEPRQALAAANEALADSLKLLDANRALTRSPVRTPVALSTLVPSAASRVHVTIRGELPAVAVAVAVPAMTHALALVIDLCAAPGSGRALDVTGTVDGLHATLTLPITRASDPGDGLTLAIASFVVARDGGRLRCAHDGTCLRLSLPLEA